LLRAACACTSSKLRAALAAALCTLVGGRSEAKSGAKFKHTLTDWLWIQKEYNQLLSMSSYGVCSESPAERLLSGMPAAHVSCGGCPQPYYRIKKLHNPSHKPSSARQGWSLGKPTHGPFKSLPAARCRSGHAADSMSRHSSATLLLWVNMHCQVVPHIGFSGLLACAPYPQRLHPSTMLSFRVGARHSRHAKVWF